MATSMFTPPSQLNITDGNVALNFAKWKRQIEIYLQASGLSEKEEETQVAVILHCAGPSVIEIFDQFEWENDDDKKKTEEVMKKLERYCNPRRNEVLETHRFWSVNFDTSPENSFEHFLTEIRAKAETCNFAEKDRMIRDKIVLSSSGKLQELLLREENLKMDKAIQICRAYEQSNKHVNEMREKTVQKVSQTRRKDTNKKKNPSQGRTYKEPKQATQNQKIECKFCGYNHEQTKEKCPAWGKTCDSCKGRNHFKRKCKKVHAVERVNDDQISDDDSDCWLKAVSHKGNNRVTAKMIVNNCQVRFQLDSAADVNTICKKYVKEDQRRDTNVRLRMWNKSAMNPLGVATLKVYNPQSKETYNVEFVIVPNEFDCLLGLKTIQEQNLVTFNTEKFISQVNCDIGDLGEVNLQIEKDAVPKALPCRKIPLAIKDQVKEELDILVKRGIIIQEVTEPTKWVSQMAVVRKSNGKLRLCIDPQPLNQALMREHYKLPVFEDILPEFHNAKIFTKLDVKEAYWHCTLDRESSLMTTMITPYGRFRWLRLPFGLKVSSEIFQRKLNEDLSGLESVFTIADDIIIVGCGETEAIAKRDNERKLEILYRRCEERNIVLNSAKKAVGKEIKFHGHKITAEGVMPDETRISSVLEMSSPQDVTEVKRLCGVVQYMSKFLPSLATTLEPIRRLTRKNIQWEWTAECEDAFRNVKRKLTEAPILVYFNPAKELSLQVDSSRDGLGAVLLQQGKPIEYASRSLKPAERNWAQIEKEALAVLYGLERFDQYTYGRKVIIENDHKPLETILKKPLSQAPKRLQDILMKLFRYDIEFHFVKGVDLVIADALSRNFMKNDTNEFSRTRIFEVNAFEDIPDSRIEEVRQATASDKSLQLLVKAIVTGWPAHKDSVNQEIRPYFSLRDTLSHKDGVIFKGEAILIPKALRNDIKSRLHSAHMSYDSMLRRARGTVFWLGMTKDIQQVAETCEACMEKKPQNVREELEQHDDGRYPWEKVGMDLFEIKGRNYLLTIDYFSNFIEVDALNTTTSESVIEKLKKQFARFGIPSRIVSDGGPQFSSQEFHNFTDKWGINHHITSPHHPKSNGKAEAGVKIVKNMMIKNLNTKTDQYEALLEQRNTPRKDTNQSPAEMMFGRQTRSLLPKVQKETNQNETRSKRKKSIKKHYDKKSKSLPKVTEGQSVYFKHKMNEPWQKGKITENSGRNQVVQSTDGAKYDRNRIHVRPSAIRTEIRDISPPRSNPCQMIRIPNRENVVENSPETLVVKDNPPEVIENRPVRIRKPPSYLKDFVTK